MSDERTTPLWPWIVALLLGLPALYVASVGPACWIMSRTAEQQLPGAYLPIARLVGNSSSGISDALTAYMTFGMPSGSHVYVPFDSDSVMEIP